ncbi:MAG: hypothetical protein K9K67_13495 [Bacteriovoracaceae bacterium]|nr:hypothetical protein [Bacteriovoracaceae bacterium]
MAESQGEDPTLTIVSGDYVFDDIAIGNPLGKLPIPIIGSFIQNLANVFTDIFVILNNDWEVEQEAHFIEVPLIEGDLLNSLQIGHLDFTIVPDDPLLKGLIINRKDRLDFIEKIEIYIANEEMLKKGHSELFARYLFNKTELKSCDYQCIKLTILKDSKGEVKNIAPLLINSTKLYLFPKVEINSIPKSNFRIRGKINFSLKLKLPF